MDRVEPGLPTIRGVVAAKQFASRRSARLAGKQKKKKELQRRNQELLGEVLLQSARRVQGESWLGSMVNLT